MTSLEDMGVCSVKEIIDQRNRLYSQEVFFLSLRYRAGVECVCRVCLPSVCVDVHT